MKTLVLNYEVLPYGKNGIVRDNMGEEIEKQFVDFEGYNYKVVFNGNTTVVVFEDGSKGIATRNPNDMYDPQLGHDIAFRRAKIEKLKKEIELLSR